MEMKTWQLIVVAVILLIIAGFLMAISNIGARHRASLINTYDDCVAAGYPVLESYPSQCRTQDGRMFVNPRERVDAPVQGTTTTATPAPAEPVSSKSSSVPPASVSVASSDCKPMGCSHEICGDSKEGEMVSPCIYMPEFACYKSARCERQADGKCGWTQTPELRACIASNSSQQQP